MINKRSICKFCLIVLFVLFKRAIYSQDASLIYKNTINSTVTIITNKGGGSGFFIKENVIVTNYHVVKGANMAYCLPNNSDQRYLIEGVLAVDPSADLILLKVSSIKRPPLRMASSDRLDPGQKIYVIGTPRGLTATISDGIVSAIREAGDNRFIQITAPISPGSSGGPVLNTSGMLVGISVAQIEGGQNLNFAIPKSYLTRLLSNMKATPIPLSFLYDLEQQSANRRREHDRVIDINLIRRGKPALSLDYLVNVDNYSLFLFTYKQKNNYQLYETIFMENYRLVDLSTGKTYYAQETNLPGKDNPRVIFNNTETSFYVAFERLPPNLRRFSLMENYCDASSFCFENIDLKEFQDAQKFNIDSYLESENEGTICFYTNCNEGGPIGIYIDGYFIGNLTQFFQNTFVAQCGDVGTLTLRLNAGTYNIVARNSNYSWNEQVTVIRNKCITRKFSTMRNNN